MEKEASQTDAVPQSTVGRSWSMSQGDLDDDGKPDVLIGGWGTQIRLLLSNRGSYYKGLPPFRKLEPKQ